MNDPLVTTSKFLSYVLRHKPDTIGLELDAEGWADVEELIEKAGLPLTRALLEEIVATSDKKRFALSGDGRLIRANQGHSLKVDLGLPASKPPQRLYHGTATRFLDSITQQGLISGNRQYVHLSGDEDTARSVGQRHGQPVILRIMSGSMHEEGFRFYQADNGVWLTDAVPVRFISLS